MNNPNKEIKAQGSEKRRLPIIVICAVVVAIVTAILCFTLIPNKDGETEKQETPSIAYYAFCDCDYLTDVYYMGTEEEWKSIQIYAYNQPLKEATIHYNYTPEP